MAADTATAVAIASWMVNTPSEQSSALLFVTAPSYTLHPLFDIDMMATIWVVRTCGIEGLLARFLLPESFISLKCEVNRGPLAVWADDEVGW